MSHDNLLDKEMKLHNRLLKSANLFFDKKEYEKGFWCLKTLADLIAEKHEPIN